MPLDKDGDGKVIRDAIRRRDPWYVRQRMDLRKTNATICRRRMEMSLDSNCDRNLVDFLSCSVRGRIQDLDDEEEGNEEVNNVEETLL